MNNKKLPGYCDGCILEKCKFKNSEKFILNCPADPDAYLYPLRSKKKEDQGHGRFNFKIDNLS